MIMTGEFFLWHTIQHVDEISVKRHTVSFADVTGSLWLSISLRGRVIVTHD
jgi:hypothetical protein